MTTRIHLIACLALIVTGSARPQGIDNAYPFDTPAEPRSVGMGESFVALPSNPSALMYNPAGLAGLQGISLSYSRRALNIVPVIDEAMCYSLNGTVTLPFGVFGIQYNRRLLGTFLGWTVENIDGPGTEYTFYSEDVAVGFGTMLLNGLAVGAAAKYYVDLFGGSKPAYLFDFGLLYTVTDSLSVGASIQNIAVKEDTKIGNYTVQETIPEYFRIGISYVFRLPPRDESTLTPIAVVVTGEYRNLLNYYPDTFRGRSYWGAGIEATLFEFLSLRGGASFVPFTGFDGERDRPAYRYGVGLNIPFRKIGTELPLLISVNYAVQPLNQVVNPLLAGYSQKSSLPAFSLDVHYVTNLW